MNKIIFYKIFNLLLVCFLVIVLSGYFFVDFSGGIERFFLDNELKNSASLSTIKITNNFENNLQISGSSALVKISNNNFTYLYKNDIEKILPIASITKLMTARIVLNNYNLSQKIIITKEAEEQLGSLKSGDEFFIKDLLQIMLIESDNTAAFALSGFLGQDKFVDLMNKEAEKLGLKDTKFSNSIGFGNNVNSTIKDIVVFVDFLIKENSEIFQITQKKEFDLYDTKNILKHKAKSTNQLYFDNDVLWKDKILGAKTGLNKYAGECLLLLLKSPDDDGYLLNIVLNSENRFKETKKIINYYIEWN